MNQAIAGNRVATEHSSQHVIIDTRSSYSLDGDEIWRHRDLLYFLIWRDLKVRYKQTALGVAWVILQPLSMTLVFTLVLGRLVRVSSGSIPYALFAYCGLIIWMFFSASIYTVGNCLLQNAHLITKVYFPRLIIPIATIVGRLVDLAVTLTILFGLMAWYGVGISSRILLLPIAILLLAFFSLAFGLWIAAVNVKYRDVGLALPALVQLWMFLSPIVYPVTQVPERWRLVYSLNPLVGILETFRSALFGTELNWVAFAIPTLVTVVLLPYGTLLFQRRTKTFTDVV